MITDGEHGLLVEMQDTPGLTDAIRRVVTDAELRDSLITKGRRLIEEQYSFSQRMAKVKAIYDRVLGLVDSDETEDAKSPAAFNRSSSSDGLALNAAN
jgi:hypothetical protein